MEPQNPLPIVVQLDDTDSPVDVVDAAALAEFVAGTHPVARTVKLTRVRADATLLPDCVVPVRDATAPWQTSVLSRGDGWTLHTMRWPSGRAQLTVSAVNREVADTILRSATRDAVETAPEDTSKFGFWHLGRRGATRSERALDVEAWAEIRGNYAGECLASIDRLMVADPALDEGRLALLYGPPGTGKTTLIRAVADAWREWCSVDIVLDADAMLGDPDYLMHVLLDTEGDDDDKRWRLLVLEDCGEFVRVDAKQEKGQGLSRLLNLTDGLLGQGSKLMVLISTNDELARLHPAITRPGRCFAQIRVGPLPHAEAVRWLGRRDGVGPDGATLAELYALRRDPGSSVESVAGHPGQYL